LWAKELINKLDIGDSDTILDIGCGDGKVTNLLSSLTLGKVVGIDFSQEMIELAKSSYSAPIFMQMDAQSIQFKDEFDIIFSNAALH